MEGDPPSPIPERAVKAPMRDAALQRGMSRLGSSRKSQELLKWKGTQTSQGREPLTVMGGLLWDVPHRVHYPMAPIPAWRLASTRYTQQHNNDSDSALMPGWYVLPT